VGVAHGPPDTFTPAAHPSSLDLRVVSLNINGFTVESTYHTLRQFALTADGSFFQESRFTNSKAHESAQHHWNQLTNGKEQWFEAPPRHPQNPSERCCRGVVTTLGHGCCFTDATLIP